MMQYEFENLIGHEISSDEYEKIEKIYISVEGFTKQTMVNIYRIGIVIIDPLYDYIVKSESLTNDNTELLAENEVLSNKISSLKESREQLQDKYDALNFYNFKLEDDFINCTNEVGSLKEENEELQTQLHRYQALFADIEKNMTVSLYSALMGSVQ